MKKWIYNGAVYGKDEIREVYRQYVWDCLDNYHYEGIPALEDFENSPDDYLTEYKEGYNTIKEILVELVFMKRENPKSCPDYQAGWNTGWNSALRHVEEFIEERTGLRYSA